MRSQSSSLKTSLSIVSKREHVHVLSVRLAADVAHAVITIIQRHGLLLPTRPHGLTVPQMRDDDAKGMAVTYSHREVQLRFLVRACRLPECLEPNGLEGVLQDPVQVVSERTTRSRRTEQLERGSQIEQRRRHTTCRCTRAILLS